MAAVAVWSIGANSDLLIASVSYGLLHDDTWDERIRVVDQLLSAAEDKARFDSPISKTVFGLPATYLTTAGDITNDVRLHLKNSQSFLNLIQSGLCHLLRQLLFRLKRMKGFPQALY